MGWNRRNQVQLSEFESTQCAFRRGTSRVSHTIPIWVIYAAWAAVTGGIDLADLDSSAHERHTDRRIGRLSKAERINVAHCFVQMTPRR